MTSLAELRAIEEERVAAERAAVIEVAAARERARRAAEAQVRAAHDAEVAAARAAVIAREREREAAERAARVTIEAAEAAERARLEAALAQARLVGELALRRDTMARQRPTWMVAVTAAALVAAAGLGWYAVDRQRASAVAIAARQDAERARATAREEAAQAGRELDGMTTQLASLDGRIATSLAAYERAADARARDVAAAQLRTLRAEQAAIQQHKDDVRRRQDRLDRTRKFEISESCKKNPLARECL